MSKAQSLNFSYTLDLWALHLVIAETGYVSITDGVILNWITICYSESSTVDSDFNTGTMTAGHRNLKK